MRFASMSGLVLFAIGIFALAGGCHLIVGIRDAEPYPPDGGAGGAAACTPEQTQDCYGGPEQTRGVGACKAGTQTCQVDGEWGPCEGEVLPGTEDCSQPEDEDCNGYACSETLWVKQFGDPSTEAYSEDVAVDPLTGDIYFTGYFSGTLTMGAATLGSQGDGTAAFLAKFDRDGKPLWSKQVGELDGSYTRSATVAVDRDGNVLLVGATSTTLSLGGDELPAGVFVGKFDSSGQHLWSMACHSVGQAYRQAHGAVDPTSGDVILGGYFGMGSLTCGNISLMGSSEVFVARLAALDGSVIFANAFSGAGNDFMFGVAVDEQGSISVAGNGSGLGFGGPLLTGGYVVKLASNGSHVWSKPIGDGGPHAIAYDAAGGLAVTGRGDDTGVLNFGGRDLVPIGQNDLFVARWDESGNYLWSRRFGSPGANRSGGTDVTIDSQGNLAVTGLVWGNVPVDGVILTGDSNAFVTKFDAFGKAAWSRTLAADEAYAVAFSSLNELVVGGQSIVAADFGEGLVNPVGESDLFILKFAP